MKWEKIEKMYDNKAGENETKERIWERQDRFGLSKKGRVGENVIR
jgi:hypothetical protein